MPERNAEVPQILIIEVRENLTVDRMLGKYRRILGKPDLVQPSCHVMRRTHPGSAPSPDELRQPTPVAAISTGQALGAGVGHTPG